MDALTFIATVVKALLWPVVVIVALTAFRKELRTLLAQIKKGKVGAAEFEFERALLELPAAAQSANAGDARLPPPLVPYNDTRRQVVNAWVQLEDAVRDLLRSRNLPESTLPRRAPGLARALAELKLLTSAQIDWFLDLRQLSIRAANDPDLDPSDEATQNFIQSADELRALVEHAARNGNASDSFPAQGTALDPGMVPAS